MSKRTILIVLAIIVGVAAFLFLTKPAEETQGSVSNHTKGAGTSGVVLIEYGDFQCPACGQYFPILNQVKEKYGDQITFQFRHFPLEAIHKNARAAARAAEAANLQGKFWEMHDQLYNYQSQWQDTSDPLKVFEGYAQTIGVADIAKFTADYKSSAVNAIINADLKVGRDLNISATPTFVLDGAKLDENPGASVDAFSKLIDEAIAKKTGTQPASDQDSTEEETAQ